MTHLAGNHEHGSYHNIKILNLSCDNINIIDLLSQDLVTEQF